MKPQAISLLIALLFCMQANAQLILTVEENTAWIDRLSAEKELAEQLDILRARILADTNVQVGGAVHGAILKAKNRQWGACKPMLIVDGYLIRITDWTDSQAIEDLSRALTTDKIKQLKILEKPSLAIYGSHSLCGVILLTAKNKKARRALFLDKFQ